jgi:Family of unknown function (DUF5318)
MEFRSGAQRLGEPIDGVVSYRMARRAVLAAVQSGQRGRSEVCDAHPELVRAAVHHGHATGEDCPLCDDAELVHVSYVFGPRLPAHGRCITSKAELGRLRQRKGTFTRYVVEVCPACRWNHLDRAEPLR